MHYVSLTYENLAIHSLSKLGVEAGLKQVHQQHTIGEVLVDVLGLQVALVQEDVGPSQQSLGLG